MENPLVVGILNIVEDKLREFGIQIPDDDREESSDPIVGYQYAELHDRIKEYLEDQGIVNDQFRLERFERDLEPSRGSLKQSENISDHDDDVELNSTILNDEGEIIKETLFSVDRSWLRNYFGLDNNTQLEAFLTNSDSWDPTEILQDALKNPMASKYAIGDVSVYQPKQALSDLIEKAGARTSEQPAPAQIPLTVDKVEKYLKGQGYPHPDAAFIDTFMSAGESQHQYNECVNNNYALCDFDRWMHLQDVMGIELTFQCAMGIENALWENDEEALEMNTVDDIHEGIAPKKLADILSAHSKMKQAETER